MVRACGTFPLLGGGDINLYSLFVERAMSLIKPEGLVGLLTPSGIYADKTAARFVQSLSTTGRIGGLFEFENRRLLEPIRDRSSRMSIRGSSSAPWCSEVKNADSTKPRTPFPIRHRRGE